MHVFVSARDDLDKSAIIRKVLERIKPKKIGGFCTVGVDSTIEDARTEVYITKYGEEPNRDEIYLVGVLWDDDIYTGFPEAFEYGGRAVLKSVPEDADLIIMDELGLFELAAPQYCAAIFKLVDGDKQILGVLKRRDTPFHDAIRQSPNVTVIEVAEQNYDQAPDLVIKALEKKCGHDFK